MNSRKILFTILHVFRRVPCMIYGRNYRVNIARKNQWIVMITLERYHGYKKNLYCLISDVRTDWETADFVTFS